LLRYIGVPAKSNDFTHSCAKILFAVGEKDGRAKIAANENILVELLLYVRTFVHDEPFFL
jgi:hypothetical protein